MPVNRTRLALGLVAAFIVGTLAATLLNVPVTDGRFADTGLAAFAERLRNVVLFAWPGAVAAIMLAAYSRFGGARYWTIAGAAIGLVGFLWLHRHGASTREAVHSMPAFFSLLLTGAAGGLAYFLASGWRAAPPATAGSAVDEDDRKTAMNWRVLALAALVAILPPLLANWSPRQAVDTRFTAATMSSSLAALQTQLTARGYPWAKAELENNHLRIVGDAPDAAQRQAAFRIALEQVAPHVGPGRPITFVENAIVLGRDVETAAMPSDDARLAAEAEAEAKRKAEEEARRAAEAEAKRKAEEEARLAAEAEAEAQRKAEEEARLAAEAEAKRKAEEEARLAAEAEAEAKRKAEEEARLAAEAEAEAKRKAEEEARRAAEAEAEAKRKAEEEARLAAEAEAEAKRKAEEEARRAAEAEAEAKSKAEEDARLAMLAPDTTSAPTASAPTPSPDTTGTGRSPLECRTELAVIISDRSLDFAQSSTALRSRDLAFLDLLADRLMSCPTYRATISGFSDPTGNAESNRILSLQRAEAVKSTLAARGLSVDRIETAGFGATPAEAPPDLGAPKRAKRAVTFSLLDVADTSAKPITRLTAQADGLEAPCTVEAARHTMAHTLNFRGKASSVRKQHADALDRIAAYARRCTGIAILVTGHADSRGSDADNQRLSERRANRTRKALIRRGVAPGQITIRGLASERPVASNDTIDGRSRNRRVEFSYNSLENAATP